MAYDIKRGGAGALNGGIYGAQFGGPWGALAGGAVGGLGGFFGDDETKSISTLDPQQRQLYDQRTQALQGGGGPLADVYGQYDASAMRDFYEKSYAQPAYQEFQQNVVPTITGQFRGNNLQNSSYLGGALAQAGTNVQNNLNAQMAKLLYDGQQSSLDRRNSALNNIFGLQTQVHQRPEPSVFDDLLNSLSSNAGDMLADYFKKKRSATPNMNDQTPQTAGVQQTIGG